MEGVEIVYDSKGAAQLITGSRTKWSGGVVPYVIDANAYSIFIFIKKFSVLKSSLQKFKMQLS